MNRSNLTVATSGDGLVCDSRRPQQYHGINRFRYSDVRIVITEQSYRRTNSHMPYRICWPFSADQPVNALHLTHNLHVAYELMEVRTGHGLKLLHRSGQAPNGTVDAVKEEATNILSKAFGPDGNEKRANVLKLRGKINAAWEESGSSRQELEAFLDSLIPTLA